MTFDGKAFGKDIVDTVKGHIDKTVAPLLAQIDVLKAEVATLKAAPAPRDGKDADQDAVAEAVATIIIGNVRKDFDDLRATVTALSKKELPDIPAMISEAVSKCLTDDDLDAVKSDVESLRGAIAALPPAKDGATGAKGDPGDIGPAGQAGINGKDGVGLAGAMIDRKGALILTLSDGTTRELGHVVGKDVDMATVEGMIDKATHKALSEAWAAVPEPKDGERGPQGEPGKSITAEDIAPLIETAVAKHVETIERMVPDVVKSAVSSIKVPEAPKLPDIPALVDAAVKALPPAQDGKDADPALVQSLVKETVERAVAALPVAKDGQDGANGADGRDGVNGADGKSVTIDDIRPLIEESVTKAVTSLPLPKDGADGKDGAAGLNGKDGADGLHGKDGVTLDELRPIIDETIAKSVSAIPLPKDGKDGRDGLDVKDLLVVEGGELVATFADGRTKILGQFRGKDGEPGKDGANGKDGVDGIGFDDVAEELEDDGRIIVRQFFRNGAIVKESRITTKMAIFRGVHDHARTYLPGDMVTRGGSQWHCDVECKGPFNGDNWTLAVKKGRDGKPD